MLKKKDFFNSKIKNQAIIYIDKGKGDKKMYTMKPYNVQTREFVKELFEFLVDTVKLIFRKKGDKEND